MHMRYKGVKMELSIGVDSSTFTCIEGGALHHACGLGGVGR